MKLTNKQAELLNRVKSSPGKQLLIKGIDWTLVRTIRALHTKMPMMFHYSLCGDTMLSYGIGVGNKWNIQSSRNRGTTR